VIDIHVRYWESPDDSYDQFVISCRDLDRPYDLLAFKSIDGVLYPTYNEAENAAYEFVLRTITEAKEQGLPFIAMRFDVRDISIRRAKHIDVYA